MAREDIILAIAARKVKRTTAPIMPGPGAASIEKMGMIARAIAAFERGDTVYDVVVEAELMGATAGTAEILVEGILESDLELTAARAIATLSRGIGEQVIAANTPPDADLPPGVDPGKRVG